LDSDVENQDTNWDEKFWNLLEAEAEPDMAWVKASTKKTNYFVAAAMVTKCTTAEKAHKPASADSSNSLASQTFLVNLEANEWLNIEKHVGICSSLNHEESVLVEAATDAAQRSANNGVDAMFREHAAAWESIWENGDIIIEGDAEAQQGIRFNIFHLNQTYTGEDARLNIGPKGFTGEKYGGSTYWDTEAYCLPFYLSTHPQKVAK
ncbi:MAG: glycoside hydrolase family 65 protein, partial [Flavobacteriales bacterium]|nr:glycoside hydrolase family 65 protein [Flavobacteriales bacterium]